MLQLEIMCELAYMYGENKDVLQGNMEFEDFIEDLAFHSEHILKVWIPSYPDISPLQVVHDYFNQIILTK